MYRNNQKIIFELYDQISEERFTSLCYAGHLPGYTMGYNHHGLIFSINTLSASVLHSGKTRKYI